MSDAEETPARLSPAERAQRKREEKLADLQQEIDSGRLVVRQMTEEEKAKFDEAREARGPSKRGGPRR